MLKFSTIILLVTCYLSLVTSVHATTNEWDIKKNASSNLEFNWNGTTTPLIINTAGTLTGLNGFGLSLPTTGVFDDATTSDSPYSRVDADSFHTNGLGVGQIFIEGGAIDANTPILIGAGKAGGQVAQKVGIGTATPNTGLQVGNGGDGGANGLTLHSNYPTIYLRDDERSAMIHLNSKHFYVLRGCSANDPGSGNNWCQTAQGWPLDINLENMYASFGGQVAAHGPANDWAIYADGVTHGLYGRGTVYGVYGESSGDTGVRGSTGIAGGAGMRGTNSATGCDGLIAYSNYDFFANSCGANFGSSKTIKENYQDIDYQKILEGIGSLPISKWNYKVNPSNIQHIGPFAEDFHEIFGLGGDDNISISIGDEGGIALVGVKALKEKVDKQQQQIDELKKQIQELKNAK